MSRILSYQKPKETSGPWEHKGPPRMDGFQAEEKLNRAGPKNVRKILDVILYAFKAESCTAENLYNTLKN